VANVILERNGFKVILTGKKLNVRAAWALLEEVSILMGRMDIFNNFRIIFDEKNGWVDFKEAD
jgi:hypothetical protein